MKISTVNSNNSNLIRNKRNYFSDLILIKETEFLNTLDKCRNDGVNELIDVKFVSIEENVEKIVQNFYTELEKSRKEVLKQLDDAEKVMINTAYETNRLLNEKIDLIIKEIPESKNLLKEAVKLKKMKNECMILSPFQPSKFKPKRKHIGKFEHSFNQIFSSIKNVTAVDVESNFLSRVTLLENERKIVFCDFDDQSLKVIDFNGGFIGSFNPKSIFDSPYAICSNKSDDIYVADQIKKKIFVLNSNIHFKFEFGQNHIKMPYSMAIEGKSNYLYVSDWRNNNITIFNAENGDFINEIKVFSPLNIALNKKGKLFITSIEVIFVYDTEKLKLLNKIQIQNWTNLRGLCFDYDEINFMVIARENKNYSQSQCLFVFSESGELLQITELNNTKFIDFCVMERNKILCIRGSNKPSIYVFTFK